MNDDSSTSPVDAGGGRVALVTGFVTAILASTCCLGPLVLITLENGVNTGVWERAWTPDGAYRWTKIHSQVIENEQEISAFCARRRASDPDLWIVELDIADAAQFAVELDGKR